MNQQTMNQQNMNQQNMPQQNMYQQNMNQKAEPALAEKSKLAPSAKLVRYIKDDGLPIFNITENIAPSFVDTIGGKDSPQYRKTSICGRHHGYDLNQREAIALFNGQDVHIRTRNSTTNVEYDVFIAAKGAKESQDKYGNITKMLEIGSAFPMKSKKTNEFHGYQVDGVLFKARQAIGFLSRQLIDFSPADCIKLKSNHSHIRNGIALRLKKIITNMNVKDHQGRPQSIALVEIKSIKKAQELTPEKEGYESMLKM